MENNSSSTSYIGEDINRTAQDFYQSYNEAIKNYVEKISQDIQAVEDLEEDFNQKLQGMQDSKQKALDMIERNKEDKIFGLEDDRNNQLKELHYYEQLLEDRGEITVQRTELVQKLKAAVSHYHNVHLREAQEGYASNQFNVKNAPTQLRERFHEEYEQSKIDILESIQISRSKVLNETAFFDNHFETAIAENQVLWNNLKTTDHPPLPYLCVGTSVLGLPDGGTDITSRHFIPFLNHKNIVLKYDTPESNIIATSVANAILTRLLMSVSPGNMKINFIDPVRIGRSFTDFLRLPKQATEKVLTEEQDIQNYLEEVYRYIREVTPSYLSESYSNLAEYNQQQENPIPYQTIVVSDFPNGFNEEAKNALAKVMINGPMVGVNVILIVQSIEEHPGYIDPIFDDSVNNMLHFFDFDKKVYPFEVTDGKFDFIKGHQLPMHEVISYINKSLKDKNPV